MLIFRRIIPPQIVEIWQKIVDVIADLLSVPSVMINRLEPPELEIFRSNISPSNPFPSGTRMQMAGVYCETAAKGRQRVQIEDARKDPRWADSPTAKAGIFAYLGYPVFWPKGEVFGTICVVDIKENKWGSRYDNLILTFKDAIEAHLSLVDMDEELRRSKEQVEELLAKRTLQLDEAHLRLWEQKQEYQELYDTAPCGYHSLDATGTFLKVNATEQQMLGYTAEEMVGRMNIRDVVAPHCRHLVDQRWQELVLHGQVRDQQYDFLRRNGSIFPGALNGVVVRNEQGHFLSTRCLLFDDTERIAKERHIAALNVELETRAIAAEAANQAKSQFLATMSHEVRTPLNAIMGFTQLLKMRTAAPDQQDKLEKIANASEHLMEILDEILEVARVDSVGARILENTDFDFDALLRGVVEPIAAKARAKSLAFNLEMGPVPRVLHGDETHLGEILCKILHNAIKFTDKGSILMRGRVVEEGQGHVMLRFEVAGYRYRHRPRECRTDFRGFRASR